MLTTNRKLGRHDNSQAASRDDLRQQPSHAREASPAPVAHGSTKATQKTRPCPPAQSFRNQLRLRPTATALPAAKVSRPSQFVHQNTMFDLEWQRKQEQAFTVWLNHELAADHGNAADPGVVPSRTPPHAHPLLHPRHRPFRDAADQRPNYHAFTCRLQWAKWRREAILFHQGSADTRHIQYRLEEEMRRGGLAFLGEVDWQADVGQRQRLHNLLDHYEVPWLWLGIETVFGVEFQGAVLSSAALSPAQLFLSLLPTAAENAQTTRMIKFLMLVYFLDRARAAHLLPQVPCLFRKEAAVKSSRDLLIAFSRLFLRGEGDLIRHLSMLGYTVTYQQNALDEIDFRVSNLALDLRDGVRLARLVEVLSGRTGLVASMKYPVHSRTVAVHNLELVFAELGLTGTGPVNPAFIAGGHRENTLLLLWQILFKYRVQKWITRDQIDQEIERLSSQYPESAPAEEEADIYFQSEVLSLIFKWCKRVCLLQGVEIHNFTSSFTDGRALCALLSFYCPDLLSMEVVVHEPENEGQEPLPVASLDAAQPAPSV